MKQSLSILNNQEQTTIYLKQFRLIWNQLFEMISNCLENIQNIILSLEQYFESIKDSKSVKGTITLRKYELIRLNLEDTYQLLKSSNDNNISIGSNISNDNKE